MLIACYGHFFLNERNIKMKYRDQGAIGAILDEYEKTILELIEVIEGLSEESLAKIIDHKTEDSDCKSIQTILSHVVGAGYTYVIEIRKSLGEKIAYKKAIQRNLVEEYKVDLLEMFAFNEKLFEDYPQIKLVEHEPSQKIKVRWGQRYDVDQLMEHAIVHVLRHRRQIERFKIKLEH